MNVMFLEHHFLWMVSAKRNYTFLKIKVVCLVQNCVNYVVYLFCYTEYCFVIWNICNLLYLCKRIYYIHLYAHFYRENTKRIYRRTSVL